LYAHVNSALSPETREAEVGSSGVTRRAGTLARPYRLLLAWLGRSQAGQPGLTFKDNRQVHCNKNHTTWITNINRIILRRFANTKLEARNFFEKGLGKVKK
jgi:hypothetical protein